MKDIRSMLPGMLLVIGIAALSAWLGGLFPVLGGPVIGLLIGLVLNQIWRRPAQTNHGIVFSSKKVLQWAVILLGCQLSLAEVWRTGASSFSVMIVSLLCAFAAAFGLGKLLGVPVRLQLLIGAGTGICGGSAIAAVSPIAEAKQEEIAYSVSVIFLFNIAAVFLFPWLGHLLGMSDQAFGVWAGTAINDTSSVVTAGYSYSQAAGDYAVIVKLTRTTMIIPVCLVLAFATSWLRRKEAAGAAKASSVRYPWFILWFLVASLCHSLGLLQGDALVYIGQASRFMIVMALTAIGLSANLRQMAKTGLRPILLGLLVWFVVSAVSLLLID